MLKSIVDIKGDCVHNGDIVAVFYCAGTDINKLSFACRVVFVQVGGVLITAGVAFSIDI